MSQRKNESHDEYLARLRARNSRYAIDPAYRAKILAAVKSRYETKREEILAQQKKSKQTRGDKYLTRQRAWGAEYRAQLRQEALAAYGGAFCICCGERMLEFLTIDHINGDGHKHIVPNYGGKRRLGGASLYRWLKNHNWPAGYQVLCYNCNMAKGFYGTCPHKQQSP